MVQIRLVPEPAQLHSVSTFVACEPNMHWLTKAKPQLIDNHSETRIHAG